jgi:hypothetical protein
VCATSHGPLDIRPQCSHESLQGDRHVDVEFDVTNLTDNVYAIAKESEATPIQYAMRRFIGGRLRVSF